MDTAADFQYQIPAARGKRDIFPVIERFPFFRQVIPVVADNLFIGLPAPEPGLALPVIGVIIAQVCVAPRGGSGNPPGPGLLAIAAVQDGTVLKVVQCVAGFVFQGQLDGDVAEIAPVLHILIRPVVLAPVEQTVIPGSIVVVIPFRLKRIIPDIEQEVEVDAESVMGPPVRDVPKEYAGALDQR